uniref:Fibroblast growth factor receptor substrate 2a n=1 Tax=Hucho hucho TaxID=62062 RepID=A0A4W5LL86_9TELE
MSLLFPSQGYSVPTLPNGIGRYPSFGEASSRPSSRHPSVGSARLPSVGEESSHPLLVHTYVNTPGIQDDRRTRPSSHTPLELRLSNPETTSSLATAPPSPTETDMDTEPQVLLEPEGVKFILGPTPAQRRQKQTPGDEDGEAESRRPKPSTISTYEHHNGNTTHPYVSTPVPAPNPRRNRPAIPLPDSSHNANNSAQRRTALLNYENLPALPPVWETARRFSEGDEEDEEEVYHGYGPKTPSLNENVNVSLSAKLDSARILPRGRDSSGVCLTPTVFNFDFRSGRLAGGPLGLDPLRQLNYIELEMEKGSDSSGPQTPKTPTTPCGVGLGSLLLPPSTPTRRTELYAMIDIERTAAMSSLQKALPRDDGTSRKTRHNSTDLPM